MTDCPAPAGRLRFDIGEIVRQHRSALEAEEQLSLAQRKVLSAMALCRTADAYRPELLPHRWKPPRGPTATTIFDA